MPSKYWYWAAGAAVVLIAVGILAVPNLWEAKRTISVVQAPPFEYPGFQSWPTPRNFDGPGTMFALDNGQFDYRGRLPVEIEMPGSETLPQQQFTANWSGNALAQYVGAPAAALNVQSSQQIKVEVQFENAQRWRADRKSLKQQVQSLADTPDEVYVVTEAISVTGIRYIAEYAREQSGEGSASLAQSGSSASVQALASGDGKTIIEVKYDKPHYLFYRTGHARKLQGVDKTEVLLVEPNSKLTWDTETHPEELPAETLAFKPEPVAAAAPKGMPKDVVLSDTNPAYAAVAAYQKAVCEQDPTHPCNVTSDKCTQLVGQVSSKMPKDVGLGTDEMQNLLAQMCSVRGTPYEVPGANWLLGYRYDTVRKVAAELGLTLPKAIVYGALPHAGVNAEVRVETLDSTSVILVNMQFLEFANELTKVAAKTIPVRTVDEQLVFDATEEGTRKKIASSPELRRHLIDLLNYFDGSGKGDYLAPDSISSTIQIAYTEGIEVFAMAHEVGHIYHQHPSSSFDLDKFASAVVDLFKPSAAATSSKSMRELEADSFAIPILKRARDRRISSDDENPFFVSLLHAVEFYFIAQQILDEAESIRSGKTSPAATYDRRLDADVSKVAACAIDTKCRVADLSSLSESLRNGKNHPPHKFRAAVIREIIRNHAPQKYEEFTQIAELANRNIRILWDQTKEEYRRSKRRTN